MKKLLFFILMIIISRFCTGQEPENEITGNSEFREVATAKKALRQIAKDYFRSDPFNGEFGEFLHLIGKMPTLDTAEEQIVHALDAYLDYALGRPQIFDYVFSRPRDDARRYPEDFRARRSPTLNPLADAVTRWMEEGALEKDDIWEVTLEIWAHAHGYIALYRAGRVSLPPEDFKELVHRSMRRLFRGLKAHGLDG